MKIRALLPIIFVCLSAAAHAQSSDSDHPFVRSHIVSAYSLTETGWGSANRVTKPGAVYVFKIDGLFARPVSTSITPTNTIKNGTLINPVKGFMGAIGTGGDSQQVKPGDRYYLHEINTDGEAVIFTFLSLNTVSTVTQGRSGQYRLRLDLKFPLANDVFPNLTPESIRKITDPIFLPENDAASTATVTVQLGQTLEEVKKILGEPQKVMDMGAKQILIYKDVKVTLVDGKVTDAQ